MKTLGFVFPGQGSQHVGMLSDMVESFTVVSDTFAEAGDVLGYDMAALCLSNPNEQLNQTQFTQPALLTASVAMWRAFQSKTEIKPGLMAGHSLGEYSALVCAGAINFSDGLNVVSRRGEFMQDAVPEGEGALAAIIGLDNEAVAELCLEMAEGDVLTPANFNSPGQVVIAGTIAAVKRVLDVAKSKGAKLAKQLPVSVPSHSLLMKPAAERLKAVLDGVEVSVPSISVVNNVDVSVLEDPDAIRDALLRQLVSPVQWTNTIKYFTSHNVSTVIECGPGKVLTGLNKRIDRNLQLTSICDLDTLSQSIDTLTQQEVSR